MSRSRSLLSILSDPHKVDSSKKKSHKKTQRSEGTQAAFNRVEIPQREEEKKDVDLTNLSIQDVKDLQTIRKNQSLLNKNMSDYEQNQLLKLQKQILSYGDGHLIPAASDRTSELINEETFTNNPKDHNQTWQIKQSNKKLLVYPKIRRSTTQGDDNPQTDNSIQMNPESNLDVNQSKMRSYTDQGDREKQWPGKFPLYSKNIDKINLSCQYLRFKQECINKGDDMCQVISNYKQLASPHKIYNQLSKQTSSINILNPQKRASTRQDLPPLQKLHKDPFATIAQFNPSTRRIGQAEFQTDFSLQENQQELKSKNFQQNLYNQLIQQKLKTNTNKKPIFIKEKQPQTINNRSLEKSDKNTQNDQLNSTKLLIFNLLPQLLKQKQEKNQEKPMAENEDKHFDVSPQTERIQKINKIMSMKIKKNKELRQSKSLAQIDQNQKVIYHVGKQMKEIDRSKNIGQHIDQLKTLNENIKKQLQQQLQLTQPSLSNKKKKQKNSDEGIVQYLHKSETPFYNVSYYKIDMLTNQLQKVHKTPQYTLHEDVNKDLKTENKVSNNLLPSLSKPYLNQSLLEFTPSPQKDRKDNVESNEKGIKKRLHSQQQDDQTPPRGRQVIKYPKQQQSNNQFTPENQNSQSKGDGLITSPLISANQKESCLQIQRQSDDNLNQNIIKPQNVSSYKKSNSQKQFDNNLNQLLQLQNNNLSTSFQNENKQYSSSKRIETLPSRIINDDRSVGLFQDDYSDQQKEENRDRKYYTDYGYTNNSNIQEEENFNNQIYSNNQSQLNDTSTKLSHQDSQNMSQIKMFKERNGRDKARLYEQFSQTKKQLRFATDTDAVIEEEDLSFDQLRSKKFNGEFNDSLYKEQFVKNFFTRSSHDFANNSILSERGFPKI